MYKESAMKIRTEYEDLSYENLSKILTEPGQELKTENGYRAIIASKKGSDVFFWVLNDHKKHKMEEKLKFHMAVDTDPKNIALAWNIVKDYMLENKLANFKVIRPGYINDFEGVGADQHGKEITIYTSGNPEIEIKGWEKILQDLTGRLREKGVKHGPLSIGSKKKPERVVTGSGFFTYRYENEEKVGEFSWFPKDDPASSFKIKDIDLKTGVDLGAKQLKKREKWHEESAKMIKEKAEKEGDKVPAAFLVFFDELMEGEKKEEATSISSDSISSGNKAVFFSKSPEDDDADNTCCHKCVIM